MPLSEQQAKQRIRQFEARHGANMVDFAAAASLPVVLDPRFVHLLRINFFVDEKEPLEWTAEIDLLFSSLCIDLGDGLFEVESSIRALLLVRLVAQSTADHVRDVASLLWTYLHQRSAPWADEPGLERAQELTALQVLDPEECARWLEFAETAIEEDLKAERPWFVAMRRKLEPWQKGAAEQLRSADAVRTAVYKLARGCGEFARWRLHPEPRAPLSAEVAQVRERLRDLETELLDLAGRANDDLLRNAQRVGEIAQELTTNHFVLLYVVLQRLGFEDQLAEARKNGWGTQSRVTLVIQGFERYGDRWLAARLLDERGETREPRIIFAHGEVSLGQIESLVKRGPDSSTPFVILPRVDAFTKHDIAIWAERHREIVADSFDEITCAKEDVPDKMFEHFAAALKLPAEAVAVRLSRLGQYVVQLTKRRILFLTTNTHWNSADETHNECAAIERELRMIPYRDDFHFESKWAVTLDDFMLLLGQIDPTVVHISGRSDEGVTLRGDRGESQLLTEKQLAMIFSAAANSLRVVVLNGCYSDALADALRAKIECIVGMLATPDYEAKRTFAVVLYRAIGSGRSIGTAFEHAIATFDAKDLPTELLRCVTREGIDPHQLFLREPAGLTEVTRRVASVKQELREIVVASPLPLTRLASGIGCSLESLPDRLMSMRGGDVVEHVLAAHDLLPTTSQGDADREALRSVLFAVLGAGLQ